MNMELNHYNSGTTQSDLVSFFNRIETDRSFFGRSKKPPLAMRLFQLTFGVTERILPRIAQRWGADLFFTPLKSAVSDREKIFLDNAFTFDLDFDGEKLPVYSWGHEDGPVVLAIHGWGGKAYDFRSFIPELTKLGYRVVSFDGPAHGTSNKKHTSLPELGRFVIEVSKRFPNLKHAIGHSLGGSILLYTIEKGLQIDKTVLINNPSLPEGVIDVFLHKINGSRKVGHFIENKVTNEFNRSFESFGAISIAQRLKDQKILLVHDKHDREAPIYHMEVMASHLSDVECIVTEHQGHKRILANSQVINHVLEFLKK